MPFSLKADRSHTVVRFVVDSTPERLTDRIWVACYLVNKHYSISAQASVVWTFASFLIFHRTVCTIDQRYSMQARMSLQYNRYWLPHLLIGQPIFYSKGSLYQQQQVGIEYQMPNSDGLSTLFCENFPPS